MNNSVKRIITIIPCLLFLLLGYNSKAHAQLGDVGDFLQAGAQDATRLTRAYLSPLPTGLATSLNSGWNGSARPRKTLGFTLDIRLAAAVVPGADQDFNINDLGLTNLELANPADNIAPTLSGSSDAGPLLNIFAGTPRTNIGQFQLPGGSGVSLVPAPMIQAGIGLIKETDITVRYIPEVGIGDYGDISLVGGAIKHGINQYLPGGKILPVDLSVMFGYTEVYLNANLDAAGGNNQKVETTTTGWVLNALVGKTLPAISVYGGLGIQGGSMDVDILGDFDVDTQIAGTGTISDPVSYSVDSDAAAHALIGFRLRLGLLSIYAEGTLAEYSTVNTGIGLSFR